MNTAQHDPRQEDGNSTAADAAESTRHLAYAEASVMLMESLMLLLVERRVLSLAELTRALETVVETKESLVREGSHAQISAVAAGVVRRIGNSLAAAQGPRVQR